MATHVNILSKIPASIKPLFDQGGPLNGLVIGDAGGNYDQLFADEFTRFLTVGINGDLLQQALGQMTQAQLTAVPGVPAGQNLPGMLLDLQQTGLNAGTIEGVILNSQNANGKNLADRIKPLIGIKSNVLRRSLVEHVLREPTFEPTNDQVAKLVKELSKLNSNATAADMDLAIQNAFQGANGAPANNWIATQISGNPPVKYSCNIAAAVQQHQQLASLYQIVDPTLRNALIGYARQNQNFQPTSQDVAKLHAQLANLPTPVTDISIDNAIQAVWRHVPAAGGNPALNPPPNFLQTYADRVNIVAVNNRIAPLYQITEPALRDALIEFAVTPPGTFQPQVGEITALNTAIAALPANATAANFDSKLIFANNGGLANNYFSATPQGQAAFANITADHNRLAVLHLIPEPTLRNALIAHAMSEPGFKPSQTEVTKLLGELAKITAPAGGAPLTGALVNAAIQTVWPSGGPGQPLHNPPRNLLQNLGLPAAQAMDTLYVRIAPLFAIKESALRNAFIDHAVNAANANFAPTIAHVAVLNESVARLGKGKDANGDDFDLDIQTTFMGVPNSPPISWLGNGAGANNPIFAPIEKEHKGLKALYAIPEAGVRNLLLDYAMANPGFTPQPAEVNKLIVAFSKLATPTNMAAMDNVISGIWAGTPNLIQQSTLGNQIVSNFDKHAVLYGVAEAGLRYTLFDYAAQNNAFTPVSLGNLNSEIAKLPTGAAAASFDLAVNTAFPGNPNLANWIANLTHPLDVVADHNRMFPLYGINEPTLRDALVAYATLNPTFAPMQAEVLSLNREIAKLVIPTTVQMMDSAIQAVWGPRIAGAPAADFVATHANGANIVTEHDRIAPLLKIELPTLRDELLKFATQAGNAFKPTEDEVKRLNTAMAELPPSAEGMAAAIITMQGNADYNAVGAFAPAGGASPYSALLIPNPISISANAIQAAIAAGGVPAPADVTNVTNAYKAAVRAFDAYHKDVATGKIPAPHQLQQSPKEFVLAQPITAAQLDQAMGIAHFANNAPPVNHFSVLAVAAAAVVPPAPVPPNLIATEHQRIAALLNISEPGLRNALIEYATQPGNNFNPTPARVAYLNQLITRLPRTATAADYDRVVDTAFGAIAAPAPGIAPIPGLIGPLNALVGAPPNNYFQNNPLGQAGVSAVLADHQRIISHAEGDEAKPYRLRIHNRWGKLWNAMLDLKKEMGSTKTIDPANPKLVSFALAIYGLKDELRSDHPLHAHFNKLLNALGLPPAVPGGLVAGLPAINISDSGRLINELNNVASELKAIELPAKRIVDASKTKIGDRNVRKTYLRKAENLKANANLLKDKHTPESAIDLDRIEKDCIRRVDILNLAEGRLLHDLTDLDSSSREYKEKTIAIGEISQARQIFVATLKDIEQSRAVKKAGATPKKHYYGRSFASIDNVTDQNGEHRIEKKLNKYINYNPAAAGVAAGAIAFHAAAGPNKLGTSDVLKDNQIGFVPARFDFEKKDKSGDKMDIVLVDEHLSGDWQTRMYVDDGDANKFKDMPVAKLVEMAAVAIEKFYENHDDDTPMEIKNPTGPGAPDYAKFLLAIKMVIECTKEHPKPIILGKLHEPTLAEKWNGVWSARNISRIIDAKKDSLNPALPSATSELGLSSESMRKKMAEVATVRGEKSDTYQPPKIK